MTCKVFVLMALSFMCWIISCSSGFAQHTVPGETMSDQTAAAPGTVSGKIVDKFSSEPLVEAGIELKPKGVTDALGEFTLTDLNGNFSIDIAPGKYELTVTFPRYQSQLIQEVVVTERETSRVNIALAPMTVEIEEMKVVARADRAAEEFQLVMRQKAPNIVDNIGADMISKLPESDVAGVLTRVTGITMDQGKYMQVRGMPKRYSRTLLNNAVLGTTRPNEELVPLDMFPAPLIEYINVAKTYNPDLPGNFAGGLAQIYTKEFPDQPIAKISYSTTYNTRTTFKNFMTYDGSSTDWLGYDDGKRDLPGAIPGDKVRQGGSGGGGYSPEEMQVFGRSFENTWNIDKKTAIPDQSVAFMAGDRITEKLGLILSVLYKNEYQSIDDESVNIFKAYDRDPENYYTMDTDTNTVRTGGILNFGYELSANHKLFFRNFYNNSSTDEVKSYTGFNSDQDNDILNWRLMWTEEELYSGQFAGEHFFEQLLKSRFDWRANYSLANMDRPDLRENLYEWNDYLKAFTWAEESQSGFHMFTNQEEDTYDGAFDWTIDFKIADLIPTKLKTGAARLRKDREFKTRRFQFVTAAGAPPNFVDFTEDPEHLFAPENISPEGFVIEEVTLPTDKYRAHQTLTAWYLMGDFALLERLRVVTGARLENSTIELNSRDQFNPNQSITTKLDDSDWMPSINFNYNLAKDMNLRLGYSRTVSRPEFHELAPFAFYDERGGEGYVGNPNLSQTTVKNYDVRYEWFLSKGDLLAASLFYKKLDQSIEKAIQQRVQFIETYINSDEATLRGVELEFRKGLDFIAPCLRGFRLMTNYTWADSEVTYDPNDPSLEAGAIDPGSNKRELVGQPDHLFNAILEYENPDHAFTMRILYNYTGERLKGVGSPQIQTPQGLKPAPDFYYEPRQQVDLFFKKDFGKIGTTFVIENLTNDKYEQTHGEGRTYRSYRTGLSFKLGASYTW